MKKHIFRLAIITVVIAVWMLLVQHQQAVNQNKEAKSLIVSAVKGVQRVTGTDRTRSSPRRLAAAYAPGVAVVTNNVLEPDPRRRFIIGPGSPDHEENNRYYAELRVASNQGADGKVTFHVVDTDGNSVAGAEIGGGFPNDRPFSGLTDADGLFSVSGRTLHGASLPYGVTKQGFYKTRTIYQFGKVGYRCLENGRWIPWNPTLRVTLKDIRNPIPMYVKRAKIIFPARGEFFHYDFLAGDLVEPHGKGKVPDIAVMYMKFRSDSAIHYSKELLIRAVNDGDGFILKQKDKWSALMGEHAAPETGYSPEINLYADRMPGKVVRLKESSADEYYIFRSRTRGTGSGQESHYGRIWGQIGYGSEHKDTVSGELFFHYYFNPTPNDRNLEFDGKTNLFNPDWQDYDWPKDP